MKCSDRRPPTDNNLDALIPHAVNHSLALLRMGKICPKHVELIGRSINCYCCIQLVLYFIYIEDARSNSNVFQNYKTKGELGLYCVLIQLWVNNSDYVPHS